MKEFAKTPKNNYYACIFSSIRANDGNETNEAYYEMAVRMDELAKEQKGYLGIESTRNKTTRFGITVSYWEKMEDIKNWKNNSNHIAAQQYGINDWYDHYEIRVAKVKYSYGKSSLS